MKRYILNTLMCGILATGSFSCTEKYLDINSNPYEPGSLTADDYALGTAMSGLASAVVSDDVNTAQFTDCLLGGTCGGYFADAKSTWTYIQLQSGGRVDQRVSRKRQGSPRIVCQP